MHRSETESHWEWLNRYGDSVLSDSNCIGGVLLRPKIPIGEWSTSIHSHGAVAVAGWMACEFEDGTSSGMDIREIRKSVHICDREMSFIQVE